MDRGIIEDYEEYYKSLSKEMKELRIGDHKTMINYGNRIGWVQKYVDNIFKIELIEKTYSEEFSEYMRKFRLVKKYQ